MALLDFVAVSAEFFTSVGKLGSFPLGFGLSYRISLRQGESIKLITGENFNNLVGHIVVRAQEDDAAPEDKDVGTMHYLAALDGDIEPRPASYVIEVLVPNGQLKELLAASRAGRVPSSISVDAQGMEYDWAPDGSAKKWDNQASPRLKVAYIHFTVPLAVSISCGEHKQLIAAQNMPPTRSQFDKFSQQLESLMSEAKSSLKALIMWLVLFVAVLAIFHKWLF